jgi:hypothetical protein
MSRRQEDHRIGSIMEDAVLGVMGLWLWNHHLYITQTHLDQRRTGGAQQKIL